MSRKLWRFRGGLKLNGFKDLSTQQRIASIPLAPQLIFPLRQHIGEPAEPVVATGDYVYKGQLIAQGVGYISAPIHASSSGVIAAIEKRPVPHASQLLENCIVLDCDGLDAWYPGISPPPRPESLAVDDMRKCIRDAGVVGLGGAVFPSAVKLKPTRDISTLVINGVECEPFITCDDMLMREHAERILRGAFIVSRIVNAHEIIVAIEDNKPQASAAILQAVNKFKQAGVGLANTVDIVNIPTLFPAGGEKQLIKVLTGQDVPSKGLPYEVGIVCINVGTAAAVYDAIYDGTPLLSRVVTVSGNAVRRPGNFRVPIGTPMRHVIEQAGGTSHNKFSIIMGGPMMGISVNNWNAPVVKATNNILLTADVQTSNAVMPCIRCGACANSCPMHLMPQQLYWHARSGALDKLEHYHIDDCIECGCCAVVCPSQIPLVHYFRHGKTAIRAQDRQKKKAEVSRIRNEQREARLERARQELAERKAKRNAARRSAARDNADPGDGTPQPQNQKAVAG